MVEESPVSIEDVVTNLADAVDNLAGQTYMLIWDIGETSNLQGVDIWAFSPLPILPSDGGKAVGYGMIVTDKKVRFQTIQAFIRRDCPDRLTFELECLGPGGEKRMHLAPIVRPDGVCCALKFVLGAWKGPIYLKE